MSFDIREEDTFRQVQVLFNEYFPYLKIEFFEKSSPVHLTPGTYKPVLNKDRKLTEFSKTITRIAPFTINKELNVKMVEEYIQSFYSLNALVYRKSGNVWLETTVTGNWTLEEQNKQGRLITLQLQDSRA